MQKNRTRVKIRRKGGRQEDDLGIAAQFGSGMCYLQTSLHKILAGMKKNVLHSKLGVGGGRGWGGERMKTVQSNMEEAEANLSLP